MPRKNLELHKNPGVWLCYFLQELDMYVELKMKKELYFTNTYVE